MKRKNKTNSKMFFLTSVFLQTILNVLVGLMFCNLLFQNIWNIFLCFITIFFVMCIFIKTADKIGVHSSLLAIIIGIFFATFIMSCI